MTGIGYTDEHAVLPTKLILTVACVRDVAGPFLAATFTQSAVADHRRRPARGDLGPVGGIYPAIIQSVRRASTRPEKSPEARYLQTRPT